jgi:hypothetical protein
LNHILYNVEQNINLISTCQDATLKVKVYPPSSGYIYPAGTDLSKPYVELPARDSRCNDKFVTVASTPPDLRLPSDYSIRTTHGVGLYVRNALQSAWVLGQTPGYNTAGVPAGPVNHDEFWYIYEAGPKEGDYGILAIKKIIQKKLLDQYSASRVAFNATYGVTLAYVIILFFWVFSSVRKDLLNEARHNRGCMFLLLLLIFLFIFSKF